MASIRETLTADALFSIPAKIFIGTKAGRGRRTARSPAGNGKPFGKEWLVRQNWE